MIWEYLLFNLLIVSTATVGRVLIPYFRLPTIREALLSIGIVGLCFLAWDSLVIGHWWWFNQLYITGLKVGNLPVEEVLFFISVPWACLILWENVFKRLKRYSYQRSTIFLLLSLTVLTIFAFKASFVYLTAVSLVIFSALWFSWYVSGLFAQRHFLWMLIAVVLLTMVFNGYLTARPVVIYQEGLSVFKIGTIPIEDIFYGLGLVSWVIQLYEVFKKKFDNLI